MTAPQQPSPARKPQVTLAVTEQEKVLFEQIAAKRGMKTAAWLRFLAYEDGRKMGIIT